ncbi:MAG: 16S rRNA (cytidine(1402)-2'-O)-methyltransferase [Deltaproteobacteria bacterium]|nr:16S rRNA (cytidine(1402)-2'-O)-methyltransferase [Deltaproteobacteria bacterium]
MKKSANPESGDSSDPSGILYLVATPIGNLEDMTYRAVRVLKEADAVFCEDTRRTLILLKHFQIERRNGIDSFHDHSPRSVAMKIQKLLSEGKSVAYVTDGGMPVVSDPGYVLVRAAVEAGARVTVVPGATAAAMLFSASGLPSPKYLFHGFFPRTHGEVERTLEVIRANPVVHVFYEAPGRIESSLEIVARQLPQAPVVLGRELTKIHEELVRGTAEKVHETLAARGKIKGECVLGILGGEVPAPKAKPERASSEAPGADPQEGFADQETIALTPEQEEEIASLIKSGVSSKDASRELSKKFKVPRRVVYEFIIRRLT